MKDKIPFWKMIRIPLPEQKSKPLSTKKGYNRKRVREEAKREIDEK